jgi:hypothetical protein
MGGGLASPLGRGMALTLPHWVGEWHGYWYGRMARGGQGLSKLSLGLAMSYPSMPCGRAACGRLLPLSTPHAVSLCVW